MSPSSILLPIVSVLQENLEAAGIRKAKIVAICTSNKEATNKIVELIKSEYPDLTLFVRSYDREHTLHLRAIGVDYEIRETVESGLIFGQKALETLGTSQELAQEITEDVRQRDEDRLHVQAAEGIMAGGQFLFNKPVTPEPLVKPAREGKAMDKATEEKINEDISTSDRSQLSA